MKENINISVSTIRGTANFTLGKLSRGVLRSIAYVVVFALAVTVGVISSLKTEVNFFKLKRQELEDHSLLVTAKLIELKVLKAELENDLQEREERLNTVADKLGDLEVMLGIEEVEPDVNLESRLDAASVTSTVRKQMLSMIPNGSPVKKARTSSRYGKRIHPVTKASKFHRGHDFAVNIGTPIYAPADGVVEVVRKSNKGSGNFLRLQHGYGFSSSYSHLQAFKVRSGDFVKRGDLIALSGNTGLSSGPHLHYEVRFVGRAFDPQPFINWGMDNFESLFTQVRGIKWESLIEKVELRVTNQRRPSSREAVKLTGKSMSKEISKSTVL